MLKIAITGNIAAGKSTVENILRDNGYKVFDTDKMAHEILEKSVTIKNHFGTNNRKKIADIVFSNNEELKFLESIIHPQVKEKILEIFNNEWDIVFISVPQLFEAGYESLFDKVIFVSASESVRLERLMHRNSLSIEEAQKRINAQSDTLKEDRSDYVIFNNSNIEDLTRSVNLILSQI